MFTVTVSTVGSKLVPLFIVIISAVSFVESDPVIWKDNIGGLCGQTDIIEG